MARENHQKRSRTSTLEILAAGNRASPSAGTAAPALRLGTRAGYDRWAEVYDSDGNPLVALEEPVVRRLLGPVSGLRIADIGCGTGRHALRLAEAGARVTAVVFSSGMLHKTRSAPRASAPDFLLHDLTKHSVRGRTSLWT